MAGQSTGRYVVAVALTATALLVGCGGGGESSRSTTVDTLNAEQVVNRLRTAGLPIGKVTVFNADTDPNHLLGRPGQYTSKAAFTDTRLPVEHQEGSTDDGGGVEVFPNEKAAAARKAFIEGIGKAASPLAEYDYVRGGTLLRLAKRLTPDQAAAYEKALAT